MRLDAILGYTGFVGSSIREKMDLSMAELFNSKSLGDLRGETYNTVYCAVIPVAKWVENANSKDDLATLLEILDVVKSIACENLYSLVQLTSIILRSSCRQNSMRARQRSLNKDTDNSWSSNGRLNLEMACSSSDFLLSSAPRWRNLYLPSGQQSRNQ